MALNVMGSKSLFWKTGIDNSGLRKGKKEARGILTHLSKEVTGLDVFAGLGISAAIAFTKIGKAAYNFSKNFQTSMKEVQTISVAVQNDYAGISDQIMNLSKRVPDLATKLSQAYYQIVSAGYDGADGMRLLEASSKLAVAGVTDTFTAADTLTSIMNAYGDSAGTAMEISDKLFNVVKLGKINMTQIGGSLSNVTGLAAQAGLKFNELVSIVSKGTKTMKPEQMITGIKGILNTIIKGPIEQAKALVEELGLEFNLAAMQTKGFAGFMDDLMEKTGGNMVMLQKLFPRVEGLAGLLAVASDEGGKFTDVLKEMDNSLGATENAFGIMVQTTENQAKIFKNIINSKLKGWGDQILASVGSVAGSINKSMNNIVNDTIRASTAERVEFEKNINILERLRGKTEKTKAEKALLKTAIDSLQSKYPDYLGNLDLEKTAYSDLEAAIKNTRTALIEKAKVALVVAKNQKVINEIADAELKKAELTADIAERQARIDILKEERDNKVREIKKRWAEYWKNHEDDATKRQKEHYELSNAQMTNDIKINFLSIKNTEQKEKQKREDGKIVELQGTLNEYTRIYGDILDGIKSKVKVVGDEISDIAENTGGAFSNLSGLGFDIQAPAPLNLDSQKQSLTEIMSLFNQHIEQLEALRQAGVDTTDLLNSEWETFANNVEEEYLNEPEIYQAVLNMKKDAELEYLEWQRQQWRDQNEFENESLQVGLNTYKQFINSLVDVDMTGKQRREAIFDSIKSGFVNMLANMTAKYIENLILTEVIGKTAEVAAIASATVTGASVASAWSTAAAMASLATLGANAIPASAGITSTVALSKALALGQGLNEGGEVLDGSDRNVDSVPVFLTKKEIVINRESAQENKPILLGMNKDKHFISKHFIPKGSFIGRNSGGEIAGSKMNFPPTQSFPSEMKITSTQLDSLIGAVTAQTMNQRQSKSPVININSHLDFEKFIVEMDKTRSKMESRGYSR